MAHTQNQPVIIIGGGATGSLLLWEFSRRGVAACLLEQEELAFGATGRCHGLLHSGARYAVTDPAAAQECWRENQILRRLASFAVDPTGGWFVQLADDDPGYAEAWLEACQRLGIPVRPVPLAEVREQEPLLSPEVQAVYQVPDGVIDPFLWVRAAVGEAVTLGAAYYPYARVEAMEVVGDRAAGVWATNTRTGEKLHFSAKVIINAAGSWAAQVAHLAGCQVPMALSKGSLLVFGRRLVQRAINRLRPPGDGDILLPHRTASILGTTALAVKKPEAFEATPDEIRELLQLGRELVPELGQERLIRAFSGVRPLFAPAAETNEAQAVIGGAGGGNEGKPEGNGKDNAEAGRSISRDFHIIDHGQPEGLRGFYSIIGGKLVTARLMAEKAADLVMPYLTAGGSGRTVAFPSRLPIVPPGSTEAEPARTRMDSAGELGLICECEGVSKAMLFSAAHHPSAANGGSRSVSLVQIRHLTRLGMGSCQGFWCGYRAAGELVEAGLMSPKRGRLELAEFWAERLRGIEAVAWGTQLQQAELLRLAAKGLVEVKPAWGSELAQLPGSAPATPALSAQPNPLEYAREKARNPKPGFWHQFDVLVVGAGLAGLVAALAAARRGARVAVLAQGWGLLELSSGAITAGPPGNRPHLEELTRLLKVTPEQTLEAFSFLRDQLVGAGLEYEISPDGTPQTIIDPWGNRVPVWGAPPSLLVPPHSGKPTRFPIITWEELQGFYPGLLALAGPGGEGRPEVVRLRLRDLGSRIQAGSTVQLARRFDLDFSEDPSRFLKLGHQIRQALLSKGSAAYRGDPLGFPAVLGLGRSGSIIEQLEAFLGCRVVEIPTLPPSVSGLRVAQALRQQARELAITLVLGFPVRAERTGSRWRVVSYSAGTPYGAEGQSLILATGGLAGGDMEATCAGDLRDTESSFWPAGRAAVNPGIDLTGRWWGNAVAVITGYWAGRAATGGQGPKG